MKTFKNQQHADEALQREIQFDDLKEVISLLTNAEIKPNPYNPHVIKSITSGARPKFLHYFVLTYKLDLLKYPHHLDLFLSGAAQNDNCEVLDFLIEKYGADKNVAFEKSVTARNWNTVEHLIVQHHTTNEACRNLLSFYHCPKTEAIMDKEFLSAVVLAPELHKKFKI